jgi:predicted nucleotidyltransferase
MAHSNDAAVLQSESVVRKKYFYMLRTTLAYRWALEQRTIPPVLFDDLFRALVPSDSPVFREVVDLLGRKRGGVELGSGPRLPHLHEYLSDAYQRMRMEPPVDDASADRPSDSELNAFFRATVASA